MSGWLGWLGWGCIAGSVIFAPQPDITAYEVATICAHNACRGLPIADPEKIPTELKRHFKTACP